MNSLPSLASMRMQPLALVTLLTIGLAGCVIPAKLPHPALRDDVPLAGLQVPTRAGWPAADWWRVYNDPQLDALITLAMKQSPDLAQAHSRVQTAEQSVRVAAAQAGLTINGNAQVTRQRMSDHGLFPPALLGFDWYNQADLGVQLQYDFDWWGKKRKSIEAALDQAHAAEAQHSAAALTLQNAVADTYFGWLADENRLTLAKQSVAVQQRLLQIAQLRVHQGVDLPDTVQQARSQLANAQQAQVTLEGSVELRKVVLAALTNVSPAELPNLKPRALPKLEGALPDDVRLDLIARRPDIAASRWQIEASLKQTDVARAQYFPDVSINAMAGLSSTNQGSITIPGLVEGSKGDLGNLFTAGSRVFGITPAVHLPIFEGGLLKANYGASRAQLDASIAQYNVTVTDAARDVATQAVTAQQIAARRAKQEIQVKANLALLASAQARQAHGTQDARESLAAEAQWLQQRDQAVSLHAQALSTDLALIKALGGGYRSDIEQSATPVASSSSASPSNLPGAP
ncbi:efflux transporter outer membrane subunit [Dyella caseinilytica]|uniref:Efflux transporter outer membrane subunit n=1 Tax=Dyella caseinilytica TaxID=1849581 RepID=A0ABX7GWY1_9GAMM|nr:efflux transporter outer membrane subunit [Dyella caseinilytica]QRN55000.1 efflux transporter outer membrane subunit [Dyella caseinilytica]GFZ98567.1 multidrug resistance transporter [Dyella caseinilytica]